MLKLNFLAGQRRKRGGAHYFILGQEVIKTVSRLMTLRNARDKSAFRQWRLPEHPGKRPGHAPGKQAQKQRHANAVQDGEAEEIAFLSNHASCGCGH